VAKSPAEKKAHSVGVEAIMKYRKAAYQRQHSEKRSGSGAHIIRKISALSKYQASGSESKKKSRQYQHHQWRINAIA